LLGSTAVRRVSVIGTSGTGKSTLAAALALRLGVPCLELDSVYHQAGWVPLPASEFRARVAAAAGGERWVIDGSYSTVRDIVWARADTVIWLDLPKRTAMRRLIWRTLRRTGGRVELWNGNRERWRNFFTWDQEESVISWAWHTYGSRRERYAAALADPANSHLRFVRLTSSAAVRRFMRNVERLAPDVAPSDTAPSDTAPSDTAPSDTAPSDTAALDTALSDMAPSGEAESAGVPPSGAGPACVPPSGPY
jgi:adenylate kinase family enzyme